MFEMYLADRLGMTVAALRSNMGQLEYLAWSRYHALIAQQQELALKSSG
jgi:hypothetical protein